MATFAMLSLIAIFLLTIIGLSVQVYQQIVEIDRLNAKADYLAINAKAIENDLRLTISYREEHIAYLNGRMLELDDELWDAKRSLNSLQS